jgi:hypothetical protein
VGVLVLAVVVVLVVLVLGGLPLEGLSAVREGQQSVITVVLVGLAGVLVAEYQVGVKNQLDEGHY